MKNIVLAKKIESYMYNIGEYDVSGSERIWWLENTEENDGRKANAEIIDRCLKSKYGPNELLEYFKDQFDIITKDDKEFKNAVRIYNHLQSIVSEN